MALITIQDEATELIENLLHSIKARGVKQTCMLLRVTKSDNLINEDDYARYVVDNVCEKVGISKETILYSRYLRGDTKFAIGMIVLYLYKTYSLRDIQKKLFSTKGKSLLSQYRRMVLTLNSKYKADQKYIAIKKELDELMNKYKK
jgi:hypothetical protein